MAMKDLIGTEQVISKVLETLDCNPWNDLLGWPADANKQEYMRLSYSKLKNELALSEPRLLYKDGSLKRMALCSSDMGRHSSQKGNRSSIIKFELGEGANLYFKLLKYLGLLF